jgi:hypothetical protein
VFLCHSSNDKPAVHKIARRLSEKNIKVWMDASDIAGGSTWPHDIGQQIETAKAAAVFVGEEGLSPWQEREIISFLKQRDKRRCPVIPVILPSAKATQDLPWYLESLHRVDLRTDSQPLEGLIWGITGRKPADLCDDAFSKEPGTTREVKRNLLPSIAEQSEAYKLRFGGSEISKKRLCPPLTELPDERQAVQLEILRGRVLDYWVDGVLKHSLFSEVLISLGKLEIGNAVDTPWKYTVEVSDSMNSAMLDDQNVSAIYDATGLLLILGNPARARPRRCSIWLGFFLSAPGSTSKSVCR